MASWRRADLKAGGLYGGRAGFAGWRVALGRSPRVWPFWWAATRCLCLQSGNSLRRLLLAAEAPKPHTLCAKYLQSRPNGLLFTFGTRFVRALSVELEVGSPPTLCREGWMVESTWYAHHRRIVRL
jgi:hypothetical protein